MIITIHGNIGSGKSVYSQSLYKILQSYGYKVILFKEPVDEWLNFNGENLLKLYYDNKEKWALPFQINALIDMMHIESKAVQLSKEGNVIIMERSSFSVLNIFSEYLSNNIFHPAEVTIMQNIKNKTPRILETYENHLVVYLKTDPESCINRINIRGRTEEIERIQSQYIIDLHKLHEEHFTSHTFGNKILIIDGTSYKKDFVEQAKLVGTGEIMVALDELSHILNKWSASLVNN